MRISRSLLEAKVLDALKDRLDQDPLLCVVLCTGYARRLIESDEHRQSKIDALRDQLKRIEPHRDQLLRAKSRQAKAALLELSLRHQGLEREIARELASRPDPVVLKMYRDHVGKLVQTFSRNSQRAETETLRSLIGSVVLRPNSDRTALTVQIAEAHPYKLT